MSDGQIIIPYGSGYMPFWLILMGIKDQMQAVEIYSHSDWWKKTDNMPYLAGDGCFVTVSGGKTTEQMMRYSLAGKN